MYLTVLTFHFLQDPTATLMVPTRRKLRPMAGRKNKEARERALLENRDVR